MKIKQYTRELVTYPIAIIRNIIRFRHMLLSLIKRDIKGRFAGSVGGLLWNFIHPVVMLTVYLFVFVYIFRIRVGADVNPAISALYITAGIFPWIILSEGVLRGTSVLLENANMIQKTHFPTEILNAMAVLTPFFSYGIVLVLLALYYLLWHGSYMPLLLLPFIVILQIFFTLGITFLSSALSVYFRDAIQLVHIIINFWIYLTPILYPIHMLPKWTRNLMYLNPLYPFIDIYQSMFIDTSHLKLNMFLISTFWSAAFFCFGSFIYNKLKEEFADWL